MNLLELLVSYIFAAMFGLAPQPVEISSPEDFKACLDAGKMVVAMSYRPKDSDWVEQSLCVVVPPK